MWVFVFDLWSFVLREPLAALSGSLLEAIIDHGNYLHDSGQTEVN